MIRRNIGTCLVISASTGPYLEILVAAKTESGGISLGTSDRKTWISKSLQTSNSGGN